LSNVADVGWAQNVNNAIGEEMRRLRGDRPLRWLEERTVELGHRVSRSTLNDLENGKRAVVPITDVMVLAAALEVPVGHLLYPPDGPLLVEALPGVEVPRPDAVEALAGTTADVEADRRKIEELMRVMDTARESVQKLRDRFGDGG